MSLGRIVDPTRWVFEAVTPYIYCGPNDFYDEGNNQLLQALAGEAPTLQPEEERISLRGPRTGIDLAEALLAREGWSIRQLAWLANLPYTNYAGQAFEIYEVITRSTRYGRSFIPGDNRRRAEREAGRQLSRRTR